MLRFGRSVLMSALDIPVPLVIHYYPTLSCNFHCRFCNIWRLKEIPLCRPQTAQRIIKGFAELGTVNFNFTGGEPLLYRGLPALCKLSKDLGMMTSMSTNGWFVEKRIKQVCSYLDNVQVSIDSPNPEENDYIRGQKGAFGRAISAVSTLKNYSVPVSVACTLTNQTLTVGRMKKLSELGENIGADIVIQIAYQAPLGGEDRADGKILLKDYQAAAAKLRELKRLPRISVDDSLVTLLEGGGNDTTAPVCRAASFMAHILPDGKMPLPCVYFPQTTLDLDKMPVKTAWHSPQAEKIRKRQGRFSFCEGCIIWCYLQTSQYTISNPSYFLRGVKTLLGMRTML